MKRILVADDHAIVRKGLKETLEEELGRLHFGEAANNQQVLEQVWNEEWDLVMLDLNMEQRSGLEVLAEIRKARPKLSVLILSMYPVEEFGVRALKLGAAGYINKQSAPEELVTAVKSVLAGGRYISAALADRLAADVQRPTETPLHETLSTREHQVMLMIARGMTLKEIAADLSISAKTVGTYHLRILAKMGMSNDIQITRYALLNKLVE
jgi:two-component system, NarL family, invasion response regulator UvrY